MPGQGCKQLEMGRKGTGTIRCISTKYEERGLDAPFPLVSIDVASGRCYVRIVLRLFPMQIEKRSGHEGTIAEVTL
jgi:hypothetical protein